VIVEPEARRSRRVRSDLASALAAAATAAQSWRLAGWRYGSNGGADAKTVAAVIQTLKAEP
jgi:hypothetical protein